MSALRGEAKADIVNNLSKGGCVNLQTGGEIRNFCGRPKWKPPNDDDDWCHCNTVPFLHIRRSSDEMWCRAEIVLKGECEEEEL